MLDRERAIEDSLRNLLNYCDAIHDGGEGIADRYSSLRRVACDALRKPACDGYFHGDGYRFSSPAYCLYGKMFRDAVLLEGHRSGETICVPAAA